MLYGRDGKSTSVDDKLSDVNGPLLKRFEGAVGCGADCWSPCDDKRDCKDGYDRGMG